MLGLAAGHLSSGDAHEAEYTARDRPGARRRPAGVRPRDRRRADAMRERGGPGGERRRQRARRAAGRRRRASSRQCRFSYELRLHRARGYGALKAILDILARRRRADADRDLAAPAAHAGLDQGLPVVARGRRPRDRAAEALQLHRPAAARLGPPALPRRPRRPTTTSRAKCTATRCRACRSSPSRRSVMAAGRPGAADDDRKDWGIIEID